MAGGFEMHTVGLDKLLATFDEVRAETLPTLKQVAEKGAYNIKTAARRRASGLSHAPHYPFSITYDVTADRYAVRAEIGPDKALEGLQGGLGNILEYGAPAQNTAPHPHLNPAFDAEIPRVQRALADGVANDWKKAG